MNARRHFQQRWTANKEKEQSEIEAGQLINEQDIGKIFCQNLFSCLFYRMFFVFNLVWILIKTRITKGIAKF